MRGNHTPSVAIVQVPEWPESWPGWRFSGDKLVSPDGDRITPERLRGLLWRQASEARLSRLQARRQKRVNSGLVTILRIRNDDWHRERFGSVAG